MAYATCDLQMLRGSRGEYVLKEFAVFEPCDPDHPHMVATFEPPYPEALVTEKYLKQNRYSFEHLHGLLWSDGNISYDMLPQTLYNMTRQYRCLYVKGAEKQKILQFFLPTLQVYNVEMLDCPRLRKLPLAWVQCPNDVTGCHSCHNCALRNARRVGMWLHAYLHKDVL